MTPPPSDRTLSAYERMLFERTAAEIADYCDRARAELTAGERNTLRVTIYVHTDRDVGDVKRRIREHAAQAFDVELGGAKLDFLYHVIDPSLADPGFDAVIPWPFDAPRSPTRVATRCRTARPPSG